ncbi:ABC transporter ATP-binding protein [Streptomyces sp. NPDC007863]|uniref:ABC transporter ATP-binding protein n=1 Tax=Streptomyces sp. NPDC007863 TaxID=3154894 RepID=UPI0033CD0D39
MDRPTTPTTPSAPPVPPGVAIDITGLSRSFGRGEARITAADGITLRVPPGQIVAVTGRSGSGKSTLLHLLGAIERADAGSILVDGTDITALGKKDLTRYRRTVGFVFQRFHLLPALTVLDNVLAPVLPRRTPYDKHARARELLDAVGLADRADAHPAQLSGGQQQRVALARALVDTPRLLLADEPTGALDSTTGAAVMDLVVRLGRDHGTTVLIATHEQSVAEGCPRALHMRDGRIVSDTDTNTDTDTDTGTETGQPPCPGRRTRVADASPDTGRSRGPVS